MDCPLSVFNPEHDLALANNDANFNAPLSAQKLASDLSCLPVWFASDNGMVLSDANNEWLMDAKHLFPQLASIRLTSRPNLAEITAIHPWGWDNAVVKKLKALNEDIDNKDDSLFPGSNQLSVIRQYSHRRTAINTLEFVRSEIQSDLLPASAVELTDIAQVEQFARNNSPVVFKAPWSGSGKGLSWVRTGLTESHSGWCRNIIDKQGSVIGEKAYHVVQDFAMLFSCENGHCNFGGYSLFETEKGIYRGNLLMSNDGIFSYLTSKFFQPDFLRNVQTTLQKYLQLEIAPHYSGMLGVDMFAYEDDGLIKLHPCVEINLRMTMGCVARIFYDRFVEQGATGRFSIDHIPAKNKLLQTHMEWSHQYPLQITNGLISSGYYALTHVDADSHYIVRVILNS